MRPASFVRCIGVFYNLSVERKVFPQSNGMRGQGKHATAPQWG